MRKSNIMRSLAMFSLLPVLLLLPACVTGLGSIESGPRALMAKGLIATEFGAGLDDAARRRAIDAEIEALTKGNAGAAVNWKSGKNFSGAVTPGQPFEVSGRTCRRYTHTLEGPAMARTADATACQTVDGIWEPLT